MLKAKRFDGKNEVLSPLSRHFPPAGLTPG